MHTKKQSAKSTVLSFPCRIPGKYLICLISTFFWGLISHGMALFNKYSLHEDISQLFGVGATFSSGRWMLDILHKAEVFFLGGSFSLPLINGLVSIFYISLCGCVIVKLLDIRKSVLIFALSGALITSPTITGLFGYMFTAPHYCLGYFMAASGALLICNYNKWYTLLGGILLIACSVGIYQAVIPFALTLMILWFIHYAHSQECLSWKRYFLRILYLLVACIAFVLLYMLINHLYLLMIGSSLSSYQGIDSMGSLPLTTYLKRVIYAYKVFLLPTKAGPACMYPNGLIYLYWALLLLCAAVTCGLFYLRAKERLSKMIQMALPFIVAPLAINFIFVMCDPQTVHSLMIYSHVMLPIYLIWALGALCERIEALGKIRLSALVCAVLLLCSMYVRIDNICYMKAEFVQAQTIRYFTTLIARIESTDGYKGGMAVAYVNFTSKQNSSLIINEGYDDINITPYYDTADMINSFAVNSFIENWCGFAPQIFITAFNEHPEVKDMPCYPDDGSIKIIDNVVVVKFS